MMKHFEGKSDLNFLSDQADFAEVQIKRSFDVTDIPINGNYHSKSGNQPFLLVFLFFHFIYLGKCIANIIIFTVRPISAFLNFKLLRIKEYLL